MSGYAYCLTHETKETGELIDALVAALEAVTGSVHEQSPGFWLVRPNMNGKYNAAMTQANAALAAAKGQS